ncbi:hypothetical protein DPMN_003424 [Dreissena polymorpha]|uniref:Ubiquitin-like protease family profile domain-containing protein n=1 Tax=Dreissena polymorpha TaxID=45954 RepID=A0A9D4MPV9_DREPO|nr:hypothetical protein DPMN_003424 [Dreissena polymorpha]
MYDLLMLPQCKGNNHWVLLFASVMSRTVTIYDSLGGNNKALFDLFCQFMCQRAQIVNDGLEKIQFRVQSATLQQTAPWKQLWSVCIDDCQIGIAHHQGDLFICSNTALYKYSLSGTLVCRLYEKESDYFDKTVDQCAVSPTGDRLYITSYCYGKLLTLARDGTLLATFTDPALLWGPCCLHVTPAGQVLVCGDYSRTLLQVGWEGKSKLAELADQEDGVRWPRSVCYSSTTSSIIVGQWWGDNILVFRSLLSQDKDAEDVVDKDDLNTQKTDRRTICTSTLICIRPARAPTSGLKGSARFHVLFSTTLCPCRFCLAGTPGVIAVVLVTLTASLQQLRPFNNRCCLEFTALGLALSLSTAAAAETTKKQIGNQLYNRLSCQLGPDTQGHFLRMGGGGWLLAKDFWAVQPNLNMGLHIFL